MSVHVVKCYSMGLQVFKSHKPLLLESGASLFNWELAYHTYGTLNNNKSNVIWVCHALTASSDARDWWSGLVGPGKTIDTNRYFVVCANMLGSCYGSTGPSSINPETGLLYREDFPLITTRDMVVSYIELANHLGIDKIHCCIGGSTGGMQVLEWAIMEPNRFYNLAMLACNAQHSPWGIAFNEAQRMALLADKTIYDQHHPKSGQKGLEAARAIAMLSYRHYSIYDEHQSDQHTPLDDFRAASYQRYQGVKLRKRFDPWSYFFLSKAMDAHNVGRGRDSVVEALRTITADATIIGIDRDVLFPFSEQIFLHEHISNSSLGEIVSPYGHDAFLIEYDQLNKILLPVFRSELISSRTK